MLRATVVAQCEQRRRSAERVLRVPWRGALPSEGRREHAPSATGCFPRGKHFARRTRNSPRGELNPRTDPPRAPLSTKARYIPGDITAVSPWSASAAVGTLARDDDPLRDRHGDVWPLARCQRSTVDRSDGVYLTFSDRAEFDQWRGRVPDPMWPPTGPALRHPSRSAAEALAIALVYLAAIVADGSTTTVTGDVPDVESLWGGTDPNLVY